MAAKPSHESTASCPVHFSFGFDRRRRCVFRMPRMLPEIQQLTRKVIDYLQRPYRLANATIETYSHIEAARKRNPPATLLGFSCLCAATQNCDEVRSNCATGYTRDVAACGPSGDRRAGICRAEAHNKYIECVRAGGCEA
jgi:hypothetical protein